MQVFEIGQYWIAAKNADAALYQYLEEEVIDIDALGEGESLDVEIHIRRLTEKEIATKSVNCCLDGGCDLCNEAGDTVYVSYQDLIDKHSKFPCVIAKEI